MQINSNSNQHFGMAMRISSHAQKLITSRIKSDSEIKELAGLIDAQKDNPFKVDVRGFSNHHNGLEVFIKDESDNGVLVNIREGWFSRKFKSPIAFINRMCGIADKMNEEKYNPRFKTQLDEVFGKLQD